MPRALVLQITCDYPDCEEEVADEQQDRLTLNRRKVMLDLCEDHQQELLDFLDPFLKHGQKVPRQEQQEERRGGGRRPAPLPDGVQGEPCPIDKKVYKDKESLRKHAERVHGLTLSELLAGYAPKPTTDLHPVDAEHPLECPECGGGFTRPQGLAAHRRLHGVRGKGAGRP